MKAILDVISSVEVAMNMRASFAVAALVVIAGNSPVLPGVAHASTPSVPEARASFICNYATIVSPSQHNVPVYRSHQTRAKAVGALPPNAPVYICNEQGQWYQIRFDGPCATRATNGLRVERTQGCKVGWIKRKYIEVKSG